MTVTGANTFPTVAETLAQRPATFVPDGPLVALLGGETWARESMQLLPEGSVVAVVRAGGITVIAGDPQTETDAPATLDGLLGIVRSSAGDVLLVSGPERLTRPLLDALRTTLAEDSACTSVSADDEPGTRTQGVPPRGIDVPTGGVVLVRREDLILAADEADLVAPFVGGSGGGAGQGVLVALLRLLDRPGFLHRACGATGASPVAALPASDRGAAVPAGEIAIDGSCLASPRTGTQVQVLALADALARTGASVVVMRPGELHPTVVPDVDRLADRVRFVDRRTIGRPKVFHRPFQVISFHDLVDRLRIGDRLVLTHQDMIWDRTRAYHRGDARRDYRLATSAALASADEVGFFSLHAATDAASEGAVDLDRATVVRLGVDHLAGRAVHDAPARPLAGRPYLLMVGSSFWHKNRVFSLRLARWLVEERGWDGGVVLAGPDSGHTSSAPAEDVLLERDPVLRERVVRLGYVAEPQQLALYREAELVLFPSLYEGFGLIPFEAASLGTASVYTGRAAMGELLPPVGALPGFELESAGQFVFDLLESSPARARVVDEISAVAAGLTWDRTAAGYLEVYERALGRSRRGFSNLVLEGLERSGATLSPREARLVDVYRRRRGVRLVADAIIRAGITGLGGARRLVGRSDPRRRGNGRAS